MLKLELDMTRQEVEDALSMLGEGFGDGTTNWDNEDVEPAYIFLNRIRDALQNA